CPRHAPPSAIAPPDSLNPSHDAPSSERRPARRCAPPKSATAPRSGAGRADRRAWTERVGTAARRPPWTTGAPASPVSTGCPSRPGRRTPRRASADPPPRPPRPEPESLRSDPASSGVSGGALSPAGYRSPGGQGQIAVDDDGYIG